MTTDKKKPVKKILIPNDIGDKEVVELIKDLIKESGKQ